MRNMTSSIHRHSAVVALCVAAVATVTGGCGGGNRQTSSDVASVSTVAPPGQGAPQSSGGILDPAPRGGVRISIPNFPAMITAGGGSIWVFAHRSTAAFRIDPARNRVIGSVDLGDTPCTLASFGAGMVWNSNCGAGENSQGISYGIDPRANRLVKKIPGNYPVVGAGSVWLLEDSGKLVRRVDPDTGVVLARIPTGIDQIPGGGMLTIGGVGYGSVWLASDAAASLTRISTATNKVTDVIRLIGAKTQDQAFPNSAAQDSGYINGATVAFADGKAWYANPAGLFEINVHTNRPKLIPLPMRPFSNWGDDTVVSGAGSIWVRTTNAQIDRINPATGQIQAHYPAGAFGGGGDLAVAFGSLWVVNAGSDNVWREPIRDR